MHRNSHKIEIDCPASTLFKHLVESDKLKQWVGGLIEAEMLDQELKVGARMRQVIEDHGQRTPIEIEITRFEPPVLLELHITADRGFECASTYRLREDHGRTEIRMAVETQYKAFVARLFGPLVTWHAQRKLEADFNRLKTVVEQTVSSDSKQSASETMA